MTKTELKTRLLNLNIPSDAFSLDGGLPNDAICLRETAFGWEVYYSERGEKYHLRSFLSEQEACEHFFNELKNMVGF